MPKEIIEIKHTNVKTGKEIAKSKVGAKPEVHILSKDIIDGRWRTFTKHGTMVALDPDIEKMVKAAIEAIASTNVIVDQRDISYSIRGRHPDWTYNGRPLKAEEVYNAFVGTVMEKVQLFTGITMQSMGVRAGPRGYITGDGNIITPKRGSIPIKAQPALDFDLVDEGVELNSPARKVIHFEKSAGFEGLVAEDMPKMIEAIFSTSQGYLVESANKFLADCEKRGLRLYAMHDADPHGIQMQLMYGLASKSNAYMPTSFYPRNVGLLGLFPRIAKKLGLPAEDVGSTHKRITQNLLKIVKETPQMKIEIEEIIQNWEQWEFQALNGLDPRAPAIYMVEALRAIGDEIKHVPSAEVIKERIEEEINDDVERLVEDEIDSYARNWLEENLLEGLKDELRRWLEHDINSMREKANEELEKLREMTPDDLREAVKKKLVERPTRYWPDAVRLVMKDILNQHFTIDENPSVRYGAPEINSIDQTDYDITISSPEVPEEPLTKDDIVDAIEDRVSKKTVLRQKIRQAIEEIMGTPSQDW